MATAKNVADIICEQRNKLCRRIDYKKEFDAIRSICNEYDSDLKYQLSRVMSGLYDEEAIAFLTSNVIKKFKAVLAQSDSVPSLAIQSLFSAWYYGTKNITCSINMKLKQAGKKCINSELLEEYVSSIETFSTEKSVKNGITTKTLVDLKILALNAGNFINDETRYNVLFRLASSEITRLILQLGNKKFQKSELCEDVITKEDRILYLYVEQLLLEIEKGI